jgi:DNA-binding transcriptional LysR family regulator
VTFARIHVIPLLPKFLALHPELEIDLLLDDRAIDLVQEGVDVALRIGTLSHLSLIARRIGRGRRLVVGTPSYFERVGTPREPRDIEGHQAVIYLAEGGTWTFQQSGSEISVPAKGRLRFTAAEGVRAAVLADLGLAVVSGWMFLPELHTGAVRAVLNDWELPPVDIWAVFPSGRIATAKAPAFLAFLDQSIRNSRNKRIRETDQGNDPGHRSCNPVETCADA